MRIFAPEPAMLWRTEEERLRKLNHGVRSPVKSGNNYRLVFSCWFIRITFNGLLLWLGSLRQWFRGVSFVFFQQPFGNLDNVNPPTK
jgi:hypothetical protein